MWSVFCGMRGVVVLVRCGSFGVWCWDVAVLCGLAVWCLVLECCDSFGVWFWCVVVLECLVLWRLVLECLVLGYCGSMMRCGSFGV